MLAASRTPATIETATAKHKNWSQRVANNNRALDLEPGVFTLGSPREIAASLKRSAENSTRRKASPFQSAMSMLNYYINRAGKNLPEKQRLKLETAKDELRVLFDKPPRRHGTRRRPR